MHICQKKNKQVAVSSKPCDEWFLQTTKYLFFTRNYSIACVYMCV